MGNESVREGTVYLGVTSRKQCHLEIVLRFQAASSAV